MSVAFMVSRLASSSASKSTAERTWTGERAERALATISRRPESMPDVERIFTLVLLPVGLFVLD